VPRNRAKATAIYKWLRETGGSRDAAVNGSSTPEVFEWVAPEDQALISRLIVSYVDTGTFDAALYGNGIILTNGIKVEVIEADDTVLDLLDAEPIKSNGDWQSLSYDFAYNDIGTGDNVATIRWTFSRAGRPLVLHAGDRFRVTIQDDLTGLTSHYFQIQGYQE
jgi:hypothetical protein